MREIVPAEREAPMAVTDAPGLALPAFSAPASGGTARAPRPAGATAGPATNAGPPRPRASRPGHTAGPDRPAPPSPPGRPWTGPATRPRGRLCAPTSAARAAPASARPAHTRPTPARRAAPGPHGGPGFA